MGIHTEMNDSDIETFRTLIRQRLASLDEENDAGREGQAIVTLDQQAVGRLSRMDALQNQAMAKAQQVRRDGETKRLKAALARMDEGEYGYCEDCGDDIAPGRLKLDPAVQLCISCASG